MADVRSGHSEPTLPPRHCQHLWIDDVDRLASRLGDDLVENVDKLGFVFLARHISDVRRGYVRTVGLFPGGFAVVVVPFKDWAAVCTEN